MERLSLTRAATQECAHADGQLFTSCRSTNFKYADTIIETSYWDGLTVLNWNGLVKFRHQSSQNFSDIFKVYVNFSMKITKDNVILNMTPENRTTFEQKFVSRLKTRKK